MRKNEYEYHKSETDQDLLPVVNEQDEVVGSATRREVHLKRLLHRAVHVVVTDGEEQVLLQLRSFAKDSHPGWWDISVGGHVDAGEEYEEAVSRELREELGITAEWREVGRREASAESGWEFIRVYEAVSRGPFTPAPREIEEVRWIDLNELLEKADPEHDDILWRITRSGLASIRLWAQNRNS